MGYLTHLTHLNHSTHSTQSYYIRVGRFFYSKSREFQSAHGDYYTIRSRMYKFNHLAKFANIYQQRLGDIADNIDLYRCLHYQRNLHYQLIGSLLLIDFQYGNKCFAKWSVPSVIIHGRLILLQR